jgi:hypothetical protein
MLRQPNKILLHSRRPIGINDQTVDSASRFLQCGSEVAAGAIATDDATTLHQAPKPSKTGGNI